jgi:hydrogenase-1 operon protein HyaF
MMVTETLQVEVGEHLTHNVQPLLHEIRHALATLLDDGGNTVIDLRSLPLAPGEEQKLLDKLGRGEVTARLQALGPSEIVETRYPGVWVVVHFNNDNEVIGKFIEICDIPDLLRSQQEDIRQGLEQLQTQLA